MADVVTLTADQARRIALGAQGFADRRPTGRVDRRHGRAVLDQIGLLQIDSVNVVVRSQELPLFARLGDHPRDLVDRMTRAGDLFEYWGHEASHLPPDAHRLFRWRMADAAEGVGVWSGIARIADEQPDLLDRVLAQIDEQGPITVGMVEGGGERTEGMWGRSPGKQALEYLFWTGRLTARRGSTFERWYDRPERMLPAPAIEAPTPTREEAHRELLVLAARSHGVGTAKDLADYHRLNVPVCRGLLDDLVADGELVPAEVEGWRDRAYLHPEARRPRWIRGRALLSPFDSLVWERDRTERIFGFRYRIEIYVPKDQRVHGYYVLPFLLDGELVARVDLKSDRAEGVLRVRGAFAEDRIHDDAARRGHVAEELAAELAALAAFLGLDGVEVDPNGDLAPALALAAAAR